MGFFWDVVKTIASRKASEISSSVKSDGLIKEITGISPRGYHGRMYAVVSSAVSEKFDWYYKNSSTPLNDDEIAFYKLLYFFMFANEEGYEAAKDEIREAIETYRSVRKDQIRPQIIGESWEHTL